MKLGTERQELFGGPYDGAAVTVLRGTPRLILAHDAFGVQPVRDRRRAMYVRRGERFDFAGIIEIGRGREVRPA